VEISGGKMKEKEYSFSIKDLIIFLLAVLFYAILIYLTIFVLK